MTDIFEFGDWDSDEFENPLGFISHTFSMLDELEIITELLPDFSGNSNPYDRELYAHYDIRALRLTISFFELRAVDTYQVIEQQDLALEKVYELLFDLALDAEIITYARIELFELWGEEPVREPTETFHDEALRNASAKAGKILTSLVIRIV